jgi:hypothetical protein
MTESSGVVSCVVHRDYHFNSSDADVEGLIGAGRYGRSGERTTW